MSQPSKTRFRSPTNCSSDFFRRILSGVRQLPRKTLLMRYTPLGLIVGLCLAACGGDTGLLSSLPLGPRASNPQDISRQIVYLSDAKGTFCGGLLLSDATLVTAEHCFDARQDPMRAITPHQDILTVGQVLARGSQHLTAYAPTAQDLAVASVAVSFSVDAALPRLARPLLQGEVVQAWIPTLGVQDAVQLAVKSCPVLGQSGGVVELNCVIEPGASGSPLFVEDEGVLTFGGVLVARGQDDTTGIAVATHAHLLLAMQPDGS